VNPPSTTVFGLTGGNLAFLTLRLWLGARALLTGLEKYSAKITIQEPLLDAAGAPDSSGAMVEIEKKVYGLSHYHAIPDSLQTKFAAEPLLPDFLTKIFYASLGPALLLLGIALIFGIATRISLFLTGLLYTSLTLGLILIGQDQGVSWLAIHIGLVALALSLVDHNRFAVTRS
jgi:thiosulfate dehydrogenase [quinone] large subunit